MQVVLSASPPTPRVAHLTTMCLAMLVESVRVLVPIVDITLLLFVGDVLRSLQPRDPEMGVVFQHQVSIAIAKPLGEDLYINTSLAPRIYRSGSDL